MSSELVNRLMSLIRRKRWVLIIYFVGFNVLGVGDFILKKLFSFFLGIRFGINYVFLSESFF